MSTVPLRKRQLFYKRGYYLALLKDYYEGDECAWFNTMFMFGDELLHHVAGYIYREKKFREHHEVVNYFIALYDKDTDNFIMNDLFFRKYAPLMKKICDLYK